MIIAGADAGIDGSMVETWLCEELRKCLRLMEKALLTPSDNG